MPDGLVAVAHRLLRDAFALDPTAVSGGPTPAATAGGGNADIAVPVDAVGAEIDTLAEEPCIGVSARLLARGIVGDTTDGAESGTWPNSRPRRWVSTPHERQ